jgi:hypothetical protein
MKLFYMSCVFKLSDDFDGIPADAVREISDYVNDDHEEPDIPEKPFTQEEREILDKGSALLLKKFLDDDWEGHRIASTFDRIELEEDDGNEKD